MVWSVSVFSALGKQWFSNFAPNGIGSLQGKSSWSLIRKAEERWELLRLRWWEWWGDRQRLPQAPPSMAAFKLGGDHKA